MTLFDQLEQMAVQTEAAAAASSSQKAAERLAAETEQARQLLRTHVPETWFADAELLHVQQTPTPFSNELQHVGYLCTPKRTPLKLTVLTDKQGTTKKQRNDWFSFAAGAYIDYIPTTGTPRATTIQRRDQRTLYSGTSDVNMLGAVLAATTRHYAELVRARGQGFLTHPLKYHYEDEAWLAKQIFEVEGGIRPHTVLVEVTVPAIVPNDAKLNVLDKLRNVLPVKRCEVLP